MKPFNISRIAVDKPTGYNYVRVTPREVMNWGGWCICNGCNRQFLDEDLYLCFALTDCYCEECFNRIRKSWKKLSKEDIEYDLKIQDEQSLDWYKYHLDR